MLICTLIGSNLLIIEFCEATVTMPKQPINAPKVSVEIHNNPIWHPPIDHTDPYTGEIIYTTPGGYSQNGTIVITIKNRTPTTHNTNSSHQIYYTVFLKALSPEMTWTGLRPRLAVYQSDSAYTSITFTYNGEEKADINHIYVIQENTLIDFRIQTVTDGYFYQGTYPYHDAIYEGEGSAFTDFSIKVPNASDKPGISKPNIPLLSDTPTTSDPSIKAPQQNPLWTHLLIILVTTCSIIIAIAIITYVNKRQKPIAYVK
jgi:hypothetical protein